MQNQTAKIILSALLILVLAGLVGIFPAALAQEKPVNVYFFYSKTCPHCAEEEVFLNKLEQQREDINILRFEVTQNRKNAVLLEDIGKRFQIDVSRVPITIVGDGYFGGWLNEETSGAGLIRLIQDVIENNRPDAVGIVVGTTQQPSLKMPALPEKIKLPLVGEIRTKDISLSMLAIVIGGLDGFNPCAMWVLVFLIGLLLTMKDRRRMWILIGVYLFAEAAIYFVLMAAWMNLLLFVGYVFWIRLIIALVALFAGYHNLKEYYTTKPGTCDIVGGKRQQKIFDKLKVFIQEKRFWLAFGGMILLALVINILEGACSAGFPVIYTQILTLANLSTWQYYGYLLLYVFLYILDDLIVFFVAMFALKKVTFTGKYSHLSQLIGGILMIIMGVLLLLRPEWLMFNF